MPPPPPFKHILPPFRHIVESTHGRSPPWPSPTPTSSSLTPTPTLASTPAPTLRMLASQALSPDPDGLVDLIESLAPSPAPFTASTLAVVDQALKDKG